MVWPEIYHFSPLSFSLARVCGRNLVLLRFKKNNKLKSSFCSLSPFLSLEGTSILILPTAPYPVLQELPPMKLVCGSLPAKVVLIPLGCPSFCYLSLLSRILAVRARSCLLLCIWAVPGTLLGWSYHTFRALMKNKGTKSFAPGQCSDWCWCSCFVQLEEWDQWVSTSESQAPPA